MQFSLAASPVERRANELWREPEALRMRRRSVLLIGGCGYIGSYLYRRLNGDARTVEVCDLGWRDNPGQIPVLGVNYADLDAATIARFDAILWFAGHSSVQHALADPRGALHNNCLNLYALASRLAPQQILVYASTASLYSKAPSRRLDRWGDLGLAGATCALAEDSISEVPATNAYDISKFAFDYLCQNFLKNTYGLRMGTLAGFSLNLRPELIFNAMNLSARREGVVHVRNAEAWRTILFLDDLWIFIRKILEGGVSPGIYNLGSISTPIGELASRIAQVWGAQIHDDGKAPGYSFRMDCSRMQAVCGSLLTERSLEEECRAFIRLVEVSA